MSNLQAQERPKLVVGIVVDQMKMEYLYRFSMIFSNDGFKRLMGNGYTFKICITITCQPTLLLVMLRFILEQHLHTWYVSNEWFSRKLGKEMYCTDDGCFTVGMEQRRRRNVSKKSVDQ
jgi:hypothetical protein